MNKGGKVEEVYHLGVEEREREERESKLFIPDRIILE